MTEREPSKASESIQQSLANRETVAPSGLEDSTPTGSGPFTALPSQFGKYHVTKLLGRGAMGSVYLAHDPDLGKEVALKVPKFSGDEDPVLLERFRREARAAGDLNHANICGVYEVGQIGTTHFIAMEYIDGRPLSDYISPDLPMRKIAILIRRLALALAQAHDRGIVHRDLKPANIMVNQQGEPVIMDFGLACRLDPGNDVRATQSGMIVGSPAYMSPEQARADRDSIGPRTDIYGLGVLFFELLTGSLPFRGPMLSVLGQLATQPPPKPSSIRADVDPKLESLCLKMLEKTPQNRPASMAEVAQSLTVWLKPAAAKSESAIALVEEPVALTPAKPAAPRADKADGIEAHKQRVTDLLDKHQYGPAIELLEKITNLRDVKFEKLVAWARLKLKEVRATEQKLKEASAPICAIAQQDLKRHDYASAVQVLEQVPPAYRSIELRDLLEQATDLRDECDHLQRDIEEAIRTGDADSLPALIKRLLKLKPNNKAIKQLAEDLKKHGPKKVIALRKGQRRVFESNDRLFELKQIAAVILGLAVLFASVYFAVAAYVQTSHGTLVVDIEGEGLQAIIEDGHVVIRDGKQEFRVKTSEKKTLSVEHRGSTITGSSREITLKRGEKRTVTIKLVDGKIELTENSEKFTFRANPKFGGTLDNQALATEQDVKRRFVLCVTDSGGEVTLSNGMVCKRSADIPPPPFDVTEVSLVTLPKLPDSVAEIADQLKIVSIKSDEHSLDAAVDLFNRSKATCEKLVLSNLVTDEQLLRIKASEILSSFELGVTWFSDTYTERGLEVLRRFPNLTRAAFFGGPINDAGLAHVSNLNRLESVTVWGGQPAITDEGLVHLKELKSLKGIGLGGNTRIKGPGFRHLTELTHLTSFNFLLAEFDDEIMPYLGKMSATTILILDKTKITDAQLEHLNNLHSLWGLAISGTAVTDVGLSKLSVLGKLHTFDFEDSALTDAGLKTLGNYKNLKEVRIRRTKVTAQGVKDFQAAVPDCRVEHDFGGVSATSIETVAKDGWFSLFNGKDLSGWTELRMNSGRADATSNTWRFRDGALSSSVAGGWLRENQMRGDFSLDFDVRVTGTARGLVAIRTTTAGSYMDSGIRILIHNDQEEKDAIKRSGATPPHTGPSTSFMNSAGEWNRFNVECEGDLIRVKLNGMSCAPVAQLNRLGNQWPVLGHINFVCETPSEQGLLEFRNIRIRELNSSGAKLTNWVSTDAANPGIEFVKSETGWEERKNGVVAYRFTEVSRNDMFVELHDASRGMSLRLQKDRCEVSGDRVNWGTLCTGRWNHVTAKAGESGAAVDLGVNPFPNSQPAPDLDGGGEWLNTKARVSLRDHRGKIVLLYLWNRNESHSINVFADVEFLQKKYPNELVVIGVHAPLKGTPDEKLSQPIRDAITLNRIKFPVLNDADGVVYRRYQLRAFPTFVLIDPEGMNCGSVSGEGQRDVVDAAVARIGSFHRTKGTLKAVDAGMNVPDNVNSYFVKFETTQGDFVIEVHRDWAPLGAERFEELVKADFYNDCKFFRVRRAPTPFMVQYGINGDPVVMAKWIDKKINDDPVLKSNKKGYVTFATTGPNSRTTQVFINYTDNTHLDNQGFPPFGEVVSGMDIVEKLYGEYGEDPSLAQPQILSQGNKFLDATFPKLDGIKKAYIVAKELVDSPGAQPTNAAPLRLALSQNATHVRISPDGRTILSGSSAEARLWDAQSLQPRCDPIKVNGMPICSAFSGDSRRAILGDDVSLSNKGEITVMDTANGRRIGTSVSLNSPMTVALSADGNSAITFVVPNAAIRRWDPESGTRTLAQLNQYVYTKYLSNQSHMRFSPDLSTLLTFSPVNEPVRYAVSSDPPQIGKLWRSNGARIGQVTLRHNAPVLSAEFSGDSKRLVTSAGSEVFIWTIPAGNQQTRFTEHTGAVTAVWISNDGKLTASASADGTVRLWNASTGKSQGEPLQHQGNILAVSVLPANHQVLAVANDGTVYRWQVPDAALNAK